MLNKKDRFDGVIKGLDKRHRKEYEGAVTLTFKNKEDKLACMLIEEYYGNLNKIESRVPDLIEGGEAIIKAVDPLNKRKIRLAETESRYEFDSFIDKYKPFSDVYKHEIIGLNIEVESHLNGRSPTLCFTCKFLFPITFKYKTPTTINHRQFLFLFGTLKHNLTLDNNYSFNQLFERWVTGEGKTASLKRADFYREVFPPDQLSSLNQGTPIGKADNPDGVSSHSALPNGDSARNIGRPSPDSPNLKYRNLDKSEANGRTPANKLDLGYVHDSGFGSARVIPYDSGFTNNSSALRKASARRVVQRWKEAGMIQPYRKDFEVLEDATKYLYAFNSKTGLSLIRDKEDIPLTKDYPKILVSDLPQKLISEILSGNFNNPSPKYRFPKEVTSWLNWAKEEEGVFEVEDSIHTQIEGKVNYLSSLIEWTKKGHFKPQTHKSLEYLEIDLDNLTRHYLSIGTILKTIKKIEHFFYACTRYVNKNKEVALRPTPVPKMKWEVTRDTRYGLGVLVPHALLEGFKNDVFLHPLDPKAEDATATHRKFNWGHLIEINLLRPFSTVQKSLHHEIIHGVQRGMEKELGIEGAGKPTSKNQSTGHLQNQGGDHSLDDIEFYTKTNDSIANWGLQVVNRARSISDLNKRIRSEVKWDSFLKTLKRYGESPEGDNGLRWRKATKLIVQTLQNAFKRKQKGEVFSSHLDFVGFKTAKEAGLIQPPKRLINDINDFVCHTFITNILYGEDEFREGYTEEELQYFRDNNSFTSKEIKEAQYSGLVLKEIDFPLSSYGVDDTRYKNLKVSVKWADPKGSASAHFHPVTGELSFFWTGQISSNSHGAKYFCNFLKSMVIHEATHAMQYVKHEGGGLPARKKKLPFNVYEYSKSSNYLNNVRYLKNKYGEERYGEVFHSLTGVEFYPILLQQVLSFRFHFQEQNKPHTNSDIRKYLSENDFFFFLKEETPKMYLKAVGVFIEEVNKTKEEGLSYKKASAFRLVQRARGLVL